MERVGKAQIISLENRIKEERTHSGTLLGVTPV
jgi:hypothetical protein